MFESEEDKEGKVNEHSLFNIRLTKYPTKDDETNPGYNPARDVKDIEQPMTAYQSCYLDCPERIGRRRMDIRTETPSRKRERMRRGETTEKGRQREEKGNRIGKDRRRMREENVREKETTSRSSKEGRGMNQETRKNNTGPSMRMNAALRSATRRGDSIVAITKVTGTIGKEAITKLTPKNPDTAREEMKRKEGSIEDAGTTSQPETTKMFERIGTGTILKIGAIFVRKRRIDPEEVSRAEAPVG